MLNPEARKLAQAIAKSTGETTTSVITQALRKRYELIQSRKEKVSVEELIAIAERSSVQVKRPYVDHAAFLYNEHGLPK